MNRPDVEDDLRHLFSAQAAAIDPSPAYWDAVPLDRPLQDDRRNRRNVVVAALSAAAVVAAVLATSQVSRQQPSRPLAPAGPLPPDGSTAASPVAWETAQVRLSADDFRIEVGGAVFRGADPRLEVHSDPGNDRYQTLELTWHEHGVEMRWYLYFASDGRNWWASEMRTYDGSASREWVPFPAESFRTPLGQAFAGDLDVTSEDHGVTSRIVAENLLLQAFRH